MTLETLGEWLCSWRWTFKTVIMLVMAVVLILIGAIWFQAWMEAKAFNRVTGKNVSTWDAVWIELRVQERAGE